MSRPYRKFEGICYPKLLKGNSFVQEVKASLNDPQDFYHDEALKLREGDVKSFIGQNICVEHDRNNVAGVIKDAWPDRNGAMRIFAHIYTDTKEGRDLFSAISSGDMKGLSVNYGVPMDHKTNKTHGYKVPREVSVVEQPFFEGAEICIAASANQKYKTILQSQVEKKPVVLLDIMAEQQPEKPEEELAKRHDELLKQLEQMQKEKVVLLEKAKRADDLEAQEKKRREQYALDQAPILKEVLDIQQQQMKEQYGAEYQMPKEYVMALSETFAAPEAKDNAAIIVASARAYKKSQEEKLKYEEDKKKIEAEFAEMKQKISKMAENQSAAGIYMDAWKRHQLVTDTQETQPKEVSVEASGKKFRSMFVPNGSAANPSPVERDLYYRATGKQLDVSVTAGANDATGYAKELPSAPVHDQVKMLPNSARHNKDGGKVLFDFLWANNNQFDARQGWNMKSQSLPIKEDE
jgi:hypothetical protein